MRGEGKKKIFLLELQIVDFVHVGQMVSQAGFPREPLPAKFAGKGFLARVGHHVSGQGARREVGLGANAAEIQREARHPSSAPDQGAGSPELDGLKCGATNENVEKPVHILTNFLSHFRFARNGRGSGSLAS